MGARAITEMYVCIFVPEFAAQAMVRLRPELTGVPVVVLQGEAPVETVCSANARALRMGVQHGMTRAELDSFRGLHVMRRSVAEERGARAALLQAAQRFSPRVELVPGKEPGWAVVLDMTGSTFVFGPVKAAVQRIEREMRGLGFLVRVAASGNFAAAVCLAPAAVRSPVMVAQGTERASLAGLPLDALSLAAPQAEAFAMWGLKTVGDLAALPEVDLVVRLGQEGKRLQLLARGEHPHLMVPEEEVFALEEMLELDEPVEMLDSLLFVMGPMLAQMIARAENRALAIGSVTARFALEGGGEHQRMVKPALPVTDRSLLLKLLHLDLQAHPPAAGVLRVTVSAEPGERRGVQAGLFAPPMPEPTRLDVTLAKIAALVGESRVGRAKVRDTHRPESFAMERFVVPAAGAGSRRRAGKGIVAVRRCRPPVEVQVWRDSCRIRAFTLLGTRYVVEQCFGPWRRSGDWWSGQVWSCEEWDVQARAGETTVLCLLGYDLLRGQWRLDGLYD